MLAKDTMVIVQTVRCLYRSRADNNRRSILVHSMIKVLHCVNFAKHRHYYFSDFFMGRIQWRVQRGGRGWGELRVLEHPAQLWRNSQISSSVATVFTDNQQLVARTDNEITGLTL